MLINKGKSMDKNDKYLIDASLIQEELTELDSSVGVLELVSGKIEEKPMWALISLYPSKVMEYHQKIAAKEQINLQEFGKQVESGVGLLPDEKTMKFLVEKYGVDFRFLNEGVA